MIDLSESRFYATHYSLQLYRLFDSCFGKGFYGFMIRCIDVIYHSNTSWHCMMIWTWINRYTTGPSTLHHKSTRMHCKNTVGSYICHCDIWWEVEHKAVGSFAGFKTCQHIDEYKGRCSNIKISTRWYSFDPYVNLYCPIGPEKRFKIVATWNFWCFTIFSYLHNAKHAI